MNNETSNAKRLLWAGFFSIFAAGVGFGVRGGILVDWGRQYGFTQAELGTITGGGLVGFGFIIILGSLIADSIGYGTLMVFALIMHVLSAVLQICTPMIFEAFGRDGVYDSLYYAMIMFSIGNGMCEVVVNPMVATLFPKAKTHYLNILHAGWPGGLIAGGLVAYVCNDIVKVHWIIQMSMFLVPVAIYGFLLLGQRMPRSEASQAGVSFGTMLAEFAAPLLLLLLLIHALVGYVELGTDSWIAKITGSIMDSRGAGVLLFIYTSGLMFTLRFFAGPIESAVSPLGLLFFSAVFATLGLTFLSGAKGVLFCVLAVTVYGIGKTFFWPTMLAVVSERFPRGGAVTLGAVGGIGMLSAGFLGGPGIGFKQDYYASTKLKDESKTTYDRYSADKPNSFLMFEARGLDGAKVNLMELEAKRVALSEKGKTTEVKDVADELNKTLERLRNSKDAEQKKLAEWWDANSAHAVEDNKRVEDAGLYGGRMALKLTAAVPATMALLYLLLILYFRISGGYKAEVLTAHIPRDKVEEYTGGVAGPMEA